MKNCFWGSFWSVVWFNNFADEKTELTLNSPFKIWPFNWTIFRFWRRLARIHFSAFCLMKWRYIDTFPSMDENTLVMLTWQMAMYLMFQLQKSLFLWPLPWMEPGRYQWVSFSSTNSQLKVKIEVFQISGKGGGN